MMTARSMWKACATFLLLHVAAFAQAPVIDPNDASARLKEVAQRVQGLVGVKGPERMAALERAATDYLQIASDFATDADVVAKAAWEAGECWRRASKIEEAAAAYAKVLATEDPRFRQRALFERASMLRRLKQLEEAGKLYEQAGAIDPESVRAHDARLWVARVLDLRGEKALAVEAYRSAAAAAVGPRRVIEADDALAKALIKNGDLDGARAVLEHAETTVTPDIEGGGEEGERIRKALDEMGARGMLRRALDKRGTPAKDAADVESARGGK